MIFNPILLDVPENFYTDRLHIRAVMPGDGAVHFPAVQESLKDLRRHLADLAWVSVEPSLSNSESYCRENRSRFIKRQDLGFFIFSKADGCLIGNIGLHRIDWAVPKFEIGYWCRVSAQGNGYIGEAVRALTDFAFKELAAKRVEIRADDVNIASWQVAEKSGFVLEGILRNVRRDAATTKLNDMRIYAKIVN